MVDVYIILQLNCIVSKLYFIESLEYFLKFLMILSAESHEYSNDGEAVWFVLSLGQAKVLVVVVDQVNLAVVRLSVHGVLATPTRLRAPVGVNPSYLEHSTVGKLICAEPGGKHK